MKPVAIKWIGIGATGLSVIATIISNWNSNKQMELMIEDGIKEKLSDPEFMKTIKKP